MGPTLPPHYEKEEQLGSDRLHEETPGSVGPEAGQPLSRLETVGSGVYV